MEESENDTLKVQPPPTERRAPPGPFQKGGPGGPGRGRKGRKELHINYLAIMEGAVTLKRWMRVVSTAIEQAEEGDYRARDWLTRVMFGNDPRTRWDQILSAAGDNASVARTFTFTQVTTPPGGASTTTAVATATVGATTSTTATAPSAPSAEEDGDG